jgi:ligand-binding sensor domain-containing protein
MRCSRDLKTHSITLTAVLTGAICIVLLWAATSARALDPGRAISQYAHTTWRMQQGIFPGNPTAVTQTADGYLWIGTKAGLLHFDGVRFVRWTPTDGSELPSGEIGSLLGARDGGLWIGTRRGLVEWKDDKLISEDPGNEYSLRLWRLEQYICDLLLRNEQLRMALTEQQATRAGVEHDGNI